MYNIHLYPHKIFICKSKIALHMYIYPEALFFANNQVSLHLNIKNSFMKKVSLFLLFCLLCEIHVFACTNLLVGKKASVDGSTMITYSADSYALYGELYHWPARQWPKGSMMNVYEWDSGNFKYLGDIAQAEQTYYVVGNINEPLVIYKSTKDFALIPFANPMAIKPPVEVPHIISK